MVHRPFLARDAFDRTNRVIAMMFVRLSARLSVRLRQTSGQTDEHHGNSAICSNKRIVIIRCTLSWSKFMIG